MGDGVHGDQKQRKLAFDFISSTNQIHSSNSLSFRQVCNERILATPLASARGGVQGLLASVTSVVATPAPFSLRLGRVGSCNTGYVRVGLDKHHATNSGCRVRWVNSVESYRRKRVQLLCSFFLLSFNQFFHFQKILYFQNNAFFSKYNRFFFQNFKILNPQSSTINTTIILHSSSF